MGLMFGNHGYAVALHTNWPGSLLRRQITFNPEVGFEFPSLVCGATRQHLVPMKEAD